MMTAKAMTFVDVREPHTGKLLFRYDPERDIVEIQHRNVKTVVDLTQYKAPQSAEESDGERHRLLEDKDVVKELQRDGSSAGVSCGQFL